MKQAANRASVIVVEERGVIKALVDDSGFTQAGTSALRRADRSQRFE